MNQKIKNGVMAAFIITTTAAMAYIFLSKNNIASKTETANNFENIESFKDNTGLSEKQIARKDVYLMLASETLSNIENKDTSSIDCGTKLTLSQYDEISEVFSNVCKPELLPDDTIRLLDFPLFIHVVSGSSQQTGISNQQINQAIDVLNLKYLPTKIKFSVKGTDKIVSDQFANFKEDDQSFLTNQYKKISLSIFSFLSQLPVAMA